MDEITKKEMEEALKKTALYQFRELGDAIEECKKCIKDELVNLGLLIIRFFKKMFTILNNDIRL